jgi:drug/metabolite transporter (DMT)-like permease
MTSNNNKNPNLSSDIFNDTLGSLLAYCKNSHNLCISNNARLLEIFFSAIGLIPLLIYFKQSLLFSKKALVSILFGTFFLCAYNYFFFLALSNGLAGLGGVLVTTLNPLITYLIMAGYSKNKIKNNQLVGVILGLIGGVFIMRLWDFGVEDLTQGGNIYFLIAAALWSALSISSAGAKNHVAVLSFSFYLYVMTTIISFFLADTQEIIDSLSFGWYFWANMIFISLVTTAIATTIYFKASTILGSATASSYIYLVPVTAIAGSYFLLGEVPKVTTLIGGTICILAVTLINKKA